MKKAFSYIAAILFAVLYPLSMISSSYSVDNYYFGFHSFSFIYIRYIIIFLIMVLLIYVNRNNKAILYAYIPTVLLLTSAGIYIEYFITRHFLYNYGYLLWLGVVMSVTNAGVFIGATIFVKDEYEVFYKRFWKSYLLMYLLIIYVSFIRTPGFQDLTVNTLVGNGTLKFFKAVFNDPSHNLYTSLICFGNVLILLPAPFIICSFKRLPLTVTAVIGFILPIIFEGYQYIFKCGNVDIDDILLNWFGYLIGMLICEIIFRKRIKNPPR